MALRAGLQNLIQSL